MHKNMGTVDRIFRLFVAAVIAVLFYSKYISGALGVVLLAVAIIFLLTSLISFCPIYQILGLRTRGKGAV